MVKCKIKSILCVTLCLLLANCTKNNLDVVQKIDNDSKLRFLLLRTTLLSRNDSYLYEEYFPDSVKEYSIRIEENGAVLLGKRKLKGSSVGFVYDPNDSTLIKNDDKFLIDFQKIHVKLSDLGIVGYRSDWRSTGIALKLYLDNGCELFYVPHVESSNHMPILSGYKNLKKLNLHWYENCD